MDKNGFGNSHYKGGDNGGGDLDDLDSLIKELEEKGNKKKDKSKLPFLNTREKFNKNN